MEYTLDQAENRVFFDVSSARRSYEILFSFLFILEQKSSSHYQNRDAPLTRVMSMACFESLIGSLGRLLQPAPKPTEITLLKYLKLVKKELKLNGPKLSQSDSSKSSLKELFDKVTQEQIRNRAIKLWEEIQIFRDKFLAHSDLTFDLDQAGNRLPNFKEYVEFVEEVHRKAHSALNDAGLSGSYISSQFKIIADEWINTLLERDAMNKLFPA